MGFLGQVEAPIQIGQLSVAGPILVSATLPVPCLLGTDFLRRMPMKIDLANGRVEVQGTHLHFLKAEGASRGVPYVQALVSKSVSIPPAAQMLIPLRYRSPLVTA